jgi:hypothetical protein
MSTSGDAQILNKPTLGDLAAKDKISNVDIANDAAIALSKIDGQIVTYTSDQNSNVTFNKDPSLKVSGGGNTTLGQSIEDFVIDNDKIKNTIIAAVKTAIEDKTSELYKKVILAALPIGSIIMWDGSPTALPCGWEIYSNMTGRFPVGATSGVGEYSTAGIYPLNHVGGENFHTLIAAELPKHTHKFGNSLQPVIAGQWDSGSSGRNNIVNDGSQSDHTDSWGGNSSGGTDAHENRPPYCAVYFIRKASADCN